MSYNSAEALAFLSTLPARGATLAVYGADATLSISIHAPREGSDRERKVCMVAAIGHFYPRSPRGERHLQQELLALGFNISIHAPREGSDPFLILLTHVHIISIHAPREGSDSQRKTKAVEEAHFYPRSPRGERPSKPKPKTRTRTFLSTLPARGATPAIWGVEKGIEISIHAPREGSDAQ